MVEFAHDFADSIAPDEVAHFVSPYLDLHYLPYTLFFEFSM